jgi:hypothetical protein
MGHNDTATLQSTLAVVRLGSVSVRGLLGWWRKWWGRNAREHEFFGQ